MKLIIYVHEFKLEVGHSRAMIELIDGLDSQSQNLIESIEVVAYECKELNKLFPRYQGIKTKTILPFGTLKPFLLKAILFNIMSLVHSLLRNKEHIKISIGIANWNADIVNIQFLHNQWENTYFQSSPMNFFKKLYKKMLFTFFSFGENLVYRSPTTRFISIAQFISQSLKQDYLGPEKNITLIPSGINCDEFSLSQRPQDETLDFLKAKYSQLRKLSLNLPVVLFIGAFERKGLDRALNILKIHDHFQFIIVGKPEIGSSFTLPTRNEIFHIPFTDCISKFYEISDLFIFPTRYEPFGLVIIEAYAMGLDIVVPREKVGASEVIKIDEGVIFFNQNDSDELISRNLKIKKISNEERLNRIALRMPILKECSWNNAAKKFQSMLFKN